MRKLHKNILPYQDNYWTGKTDGDDRWLRCKNIVDWSHRPAEVKETDLDIIWTSDISSSWTTGLNSNQNFVFVMDGKRSGVILV